MNYTVVLNATSFDPWSMINQESLYNKGKETHSKTSWSEHPDIYRVRQWKAR